MMPSLPEIISDVPVTGSMALQTSQENRARYVTIVENDKPRAYAIFHISRAKDMIKQFRVTGELANNTSRVLLVIGRQIVASSDDVKSPVGDSWFPICALPYQHFAVWCELRDENGVRTGTVEYNSCLLSDADRRALAKLPLIYPVGYDVLLSKGDSISSEIGEMYGEQIVTWLKNRHPFYDKNSLHCWPLSGKIRMNEKQGVFERLGQVFDRVIVRANKSCEFRLMANDLVVFQKFVEPDSDVQVIPGTYFVYAPYNEISYECVPRDGVMDNFSCSVERSELMLTNSIDDRPYLMPELGLVLTTGFYVTSQHYAELLANSDDK